MELVLEICTFDISICSFDHFTNITRQTQPIDLDILQSYVVFEFYVVSRMQTKPKILGSYNFVDLKTMIRERCLLLFKVGGPRSRPYCHIVEKRGGIHCGQYTD